MDGEGTVETTSNPAGGSGATGVTPPIGTEVVADDLKKDGTLKKSAIREIEESTPARGAERSYNEVTKETTVTTNRGGATVTFREDGDTREEKR